MSHTLQLTIVGHHLPGTTCGPAQNVHVGLQVGAEPVGLVRADVDEVRWDTEVRVDAADDGLDFKGPAVHGRRGERFLYLTWGSVVPQAGVESFEMFRRAKLMLDRADAGLVRRAISSDRSLIASVHLTDPTGMPRCARIDPPAIVWRVDGP